MKYDYLLFLFAVLFGVGCQDDPLERDVPAEMKIELALCVVHNTSLAVDSKAISQSGADTSGISDLNVFIFDVAGNLLQQKYFAGTGSSVTISTTSGQRNIAVIANTGSNLNTIVSLTQLQALYTQASSASDMMNPSKKLVMAAETGSIVIPAPSTPGGQVSIAPIYLTRLYTKVTTTFSYALNPGVSITPTKITLCQVPSICNYLKSNTPTVTTQILARGDSLYQSGGITSTSHVNAIPLYMYENLQGSNGNNIQQSQKTPAAGKTGLCSYLEVTANYRSLTWAGVIVYRYYLGTNTLTNFDIARNTWHQVSIAFNGNGGVTENSWRVNVSGLYAPVLPPVFYLPYCSTRTQIFGLGQLGLSTTLSGPSAVSQSGVIMDSTIFVMSKTDNGNNNITLGSVTAGSKNYSVVMRGKGNLEFLVDVSMLDFPQNNTFGFTNYPITQYVQILNASADITTWTAQSTASWLYIGKGSDFPTFVTSGTAYSWSTSSPITAGSVMYNSTGGFFQGSTTPTALAVRCAPNTTNSSRSAFILFTANNQEVARVFVNQNPQSYPVSPVGLRRVPGGVFQPGAFTSSGAVADPKPNNSTSSAIYVKVPQFYIATKECSIQNFADYLNDLGVTSLSQLSGILFSPLDKLGVITDYLGAGITSIIGGAPFTLSVGAPGFSNSKWSSPTQTVRVNGSTTSTVNGWIGNFPISGINFYGAYDYGYWMHKKSNISGVTRAVTRPLPTDMQWEAAARGVTNNFTDDAVYKSSSSTTKNGLFPYAFPGQTYNGGLTGTETSNELVKSIALYFGYNNTTTGTTSLSGGGFLLPSGNLLPNSLFIYDLGGNVQEWVLDCYSLELNFGISDLFVLPINLTLSNTRVVRGGCFISQAYACSNVSRSAGTGSILSGQVGFRAVLNTN